MSTNIRRRYFSVLWTFYLAFDQVVECQCGCQMLGLHAVLSQDCWADFEYIICPLNAHSEQRNQDKILESNSRAKLHHCLLRLIDVGGVWEHTFTCFSNIYQRQLFGKQVAGSWADSF